MAVRQKVFRIEKMRWGDQTAVPVGDLAGAPLQHDEILAELKTLRELLGQRSHPENPEPPPVRHEPMTSDDLAELRQETDVIHDTIQRTMHELAHLHLGAFNGSGSGRASCELDAVVHSTERATLQILDAAEAVDEAANTLSATLRQEQERALASDIREHVVRIFEACNFQDLNGQRIAKVLATLRFVEDRVTRMMEIWGGSAVLKDHVTEQSRDRGLVNGPRLDGASGHASQQEIDALFA